MKTRAPVRPENSLARIVHLLESQNPELFALLTARTERAFMDAVEAAIERSIRIIEGSAKRYSSLDERGLSATLTGLLNAFGFRATAEQDHNGHVDIIVEHSFGRRWKYLGECKIYDGYKYHLAGCIQLLGYCSGRESRVFVLSFFKSPAMYEKLLVLRKDFDQQKPASQDETSFDHTIVGAFVTTHVHQTGRRIELLHVGCSVFC